jgi:hypothetical protein
MALPPDAEAELRARLEAILDGPGAPPPAMTEFDAREYDERGDPRR